VRALDAAAIGARANAARAKRRVRLLLHAPPHSLTIVLPALSPAEHRRGSRAMSDVEETLKRINSHKGVLGIVIVNTDTGVAIRSTLDEKMSKIISQEVGHLCARAKHAVRSLDPQNDLTYVRVNSKKYEMLVAPEKVSPAPHHAAPMPPPLPGRHSAAGSLLRWLLPCQASCPTRHLSAVASSLGAVAGLHVVRPAGPECGLTPERLQKARARSQRRKGRGASADVAAGVSPPARPAVHRGKPCAILLGRT